jgi:class 3 adenylate cyclase
MADSPAKSDNTRRLMAIMFTDIKGYTSMMGENESATVELLLEHREIVRASIPLHDGHEHETIGDAFVVLFESVVNAVRCAIDVQAKLAERNAPLPVDRQVWIRIGVHLGDIILRDGGIYGDAVNMSARVQDSGQPGGVCITEQVKMHIQGRVDVSMVSMGTLPLKGIRHPPELYRLDIPSARGPVAEVPVADSAAKGRKLMIAAGALAIVCGGVLAMNADFGAASHSIEPATGVQLAVPGAGESQETAANVVKPQQGQHAGKSSDGPSAAASAGPGDPSAPATGKAAGTTGNAAATTNEAAAINAAQQEAANNKKVAADLVVAAQSESGKARVELLTEAVKRAPENTAYQMLLKTALKHAKSKTHRARRGHTVRPAAVPKPAATAQPKIHRHVVED